MATARWIDCVPFPETRRSVFGFHLDPQLVGEMDAYRQQYRWVSPELTAFRCYFVETAIRFLLRTLDTTK